MRFKIAVSILGCCAEGGIRTHEAEAVDLKSTPFDRSGTLAELHLSWGETALYQLS